MSDRELLELAARAAGYCFTQHRSDPMLEVRHGYVEALCLDHGEDVEYWNPLQMHEDAFRLALRLGLKLSPGATGYYVSTEDGDVQRYAVFSGDDYAPVCRAITEIAAEIGRQMGERDG